MADLPEIRPPSGLPASDRAPDSRRAVFFRQHPTARRLAAAGLIGLLVALIVLAGHEIKPRTPPQLPDSPAPRVLPSAPRERIGNVDYTAAVPYLTALGFESTYTPAKRTLSVQIEDGRTLELAVDKQEVRLGGMRIFLGDPVVLHRGRPHISTIDFERILAPTLRPQWLPQRPLRTIVLDAGHGGVDSGTTNKRLKLGEKVFTLDVALQLQARLGEDRWTVIQTRTDDRFVSLGNRAKIANTAAADLMVSIHFNAVADNSELSGTETYVLTPQFQRSTAATAGQAYSQAEELGNRHDKWSAVLGYEMHRHLLKGLGSSDRGLKRARFAVLRLVDCPAVLVEAGYLSNDTEAKRIADPSYRRKIVEALHAAILAYDANRNAALTVPPSP
ncbi:MAG: N-acetylmuramoyl-L-alanine amidase [Verrucomicrobia bacterium]|nr:MAG: N-acetylmuramoyl-L-alanine amidase [Verrucomicrobiota bacterium]